MLVSHSLSLFSPLLSFFSPFVLFKEMELLEACQYGQVEQVHCFIKTGVNVNVADSVSGLSTLGGCISYCNCFHTVIIMYTYSHWVYTFTNTVLSQASTHTRASAHPPILTVLWFCRVLHVTAHNAKFLRSESEGRSAELT